MRTAKGTRSISRRPSKKQRQNTEDSNAEMKKRRAAWKAPPAKSTRGVLAKYARTVSSASLGAVTDLDR